MPKFFASFPIILVTFGLGFVLHALAHKFTAQHFKCFAVYRAWIPGLALAIGLAIMTGGSMVFAAPGAVYIGGRQLSKKEDAYISIAGPLVNTILGVAFFFGALTVGGTSMLLTNIFVTGAYINFFLAFFNMIPFPPLDGSKVINWSLPLWGLGIAVPAFFMWFV